MSGAPASPELPYLNPAPTTGPHPPFNGLPRIFLALGRAAHQLGWPSLLMDSAYEPLLPCLRRSSQAGGGPSREPSDTGCSGKGPTALPAIEDWLC